MHELLCHKPSESFEMPQVRIHEAQGKGEREQKVVNVLAVGHFYVFYGKKPYTAVLTISFCPKRFHHN